jgi:hypothetical protein
MCRYRILPPAPNNMNKFIILLAIFGAAGWILFIVADREWQKALDGWKKTLDHWRDEHELNRKLVEELKKKNNE